MGFSNGLLSSKIEKGQKREKGDKGEGCTLTADHHFHLQNKRLTNLAPLVDNNDAVTKKHLTDSLNVKAGTNYVNNELAKKANKTDLNTLLDDYVLKSSLPSIHPSIPSNDALEDYALKVEVAEVANDLVLKADVADLNTLTNNVKKQLQGKVNNSDLANYYTKTQVDNYFTRHYITVWAEESGSLRQGNLEWSFGNGTENNSRYGWPSPVDGKIVRGSICGCSGSSHAAEMIVCIVHNGSDQTDYQIIKAANSWSTFTIFETPLDIKAGDRINFRSKTSNSSVTNAIVNILIEIEVY